MNVAMALDVLSTAAFGMAMVYAAGVGGDEAGRASRFFLLLLLGICMFVGISNVLEHSGVTGLLHRYEDAALTFFVPFFLFFDYSLHAKLELDGRVRSEEKMRQALREKETLLREVHHRVKNNLQVISSLLSLQARKVEKSAAAAFLESQNRVKTMALLHENLFRSEEMASVPVARYAVDIARSLFGAFGAEAQKISLRTEIEDCSVKVDTALPVGMVLNELLSNALRHAFPEGGSGEIRMGFRRAGEDEFELTVSDDGAGLPPGFDPRGCPSLGLKLVLSLVEEQLGGTVMVNTGRGAEFKVRFRELRYTDRF